MEFWGINRLTVLLWKNFTLKRRNFITLVTEIFITFLFASTLLLLRKSLTIQRYGPFIYSHLNIHSLPPEITNPNIFQDTWELAFVPSRNTLVKEIIDLLRTNLNYNFKAEVFDSEKDFEAYVQKDNNYEKVLAAIIFDENFENNVPYWVTYNLRLSSFQRNKMAGFIRTRGWETSSLFNSLSVPGPRYHIFSHGGTPGYYTEGFLAIQHAMAMSIIQKQNNAKYMSTIRNFQVNVRRFPYRKYKHDYFFHFFAIFLPLVVLFIFLINHLALIQSVVWEKNKGIKEYQLMIGLSNWIFWASYFITFLISHLISIAVLCLVLFAKIDPKPILYYSDPSLVFVFFLCFAFATIFFSFMISAFFSKVNFAVAFGGLLYILFYLPSYFVTENFAHMSVYQKFSVCLSSNVAMSLGVHFLERAEMRKRGLKWSNIMEHMTWENNNFAYILQMLLLDGFLYGVVTWYVDNVFPGQYGVPKPWNFFVKPSYWFGGRQMIKKETDIFSSNKYIDDANKSQYFEEEPSHLTTGIQIKNLNKQFPGKMAIRNLTLNTFEGQITVLLGNNGAGKSTTLSILSGFYPATSGEVYISGYDIKTQRVKIRKSFGVCLQNNLLYNQLTVKEHLYFYSVLKGVPRKIRTPEIEQMLSAFNLYENRNVYTTGLSGGMERKVSIIMALLGGSKVVILDEPTSGMDPASRRSTWEILRHYKQDRTIFLTTHYMDEADILGDRIAIMIKGSLKCCGSPNFLKNAYGTGYHIVMVKESHCNVEEILKVIDLYVPTATLDRNLKYELSFLLPREHGDRFQDLFSVLENRQQELGIASFGAYETTIEEVFLRVNTLEDTESGSKINNSQDLSLVNQVSNISDNQDISKNETPDFNKRNKSPAIELNTGHHLYGQQFWAMFLKKIIFNWRRWKMLLLQILALLVSFLILSGFERYSQYYLDSSRELDLNDYGQTVVPLSIIGSGNFSGFIDVLDQTLQSNNQKLIVVEEDMMQYLTKNRICMHTCVVAFVVAEQNSVVKITALFNNEAFHSPAISLSLVHDVLFKISTSELDASLTVINKPQPRIYDEQRNLLMTTGIKVVLYVHFGMAFLISGFCLLSVTERVYKAKHIQFMSGLSVLVYWFSALLWDLIIFFTTICLLVIVFLSCQVDIYIHNYRFLDTVLIFILYGWSAIPLMYLMGFLYNQISHAFLCLVLFNYATGIFTNLVDNIFRFEIQTAFANSTRDFILNSFLIFPNYNLGKCLMDYFNFHQKLLLCSLSDPAAYLNCQELSDKSVYSFEESMIGKYLISMCVIGFIFLLLIFLWEITSWKIRKIFSKHIFFRAYKHYKKEAISKKLSEGFANEDVENERKRILALSPLDSAVVVKELIKVYFKFPITLSAKNIFLEIQKGECLVFLGFNGAGKTTLFRILAQEDIVNSGDVFIDGSNITKTFRRVTSKVGYCPKPDALLEYMTGREILFMYARLWGIYEDQIKSHVDKCLKSLQLESQADNIISTYSGGNKRRLSIAIAMMGNPLLILMDEPSSGADPIARKLISNVVRKACESEKAIMLSSHSMEDCEAVCTKLAILVEGRIVSVGTPQYLKNKYDKIYNLMVKMKRDTSDDKLEEFKNFILVVFPGSELTQKALTTLNFIIPKEENQWGKVFGVLEEAKPLYNLEDYFISQITLEQIFLTFSMSEKVIYPDDLTKTELNPIVNLEKRPSDGLGEKENINLVENI